MTPDALRIWEQMTKQINDGRDRLTITMQNGNFTTFEDYKYVVGQYRGLTIALNMLDEIGTKIEGTDDE